MNKKKIILRIAASPFIFGILLISHICHLFNHFYQVMKYGGEWATYTRDESLTIESIYNELKEQRKTKQQ